MLIRSAKNTDAQAMSRAYVQTWRDTYLSVIPFGYLLEMSAADHEKAFLHELTATAVIGFVAEEAGDLVGFITGGNERHGDRVYGGEIHALYVLRNFQRRGIGKKLVLSLAGKLHQSGRYSMLVRVLKLNPYRRFYEKINGTYLKTEHQQFAGETVEVAVYGWLDTTLIGE
jgi:GNAT superfamily N-acetyltransferase